MTIAADRPSALGPLETALSERFAFDRRQLPVLLTALLVFGAVWQTRQMSSALALSVGLWSGFCAACLGVAVGGRLRSWRLIDGPGIAALVCLALAAAWIGRGIEALLWTPSDLSPVDQAVRYSWHAGFVGLLLAWPIAQSVASAAKLARVEAERAQATASLLALQAQIEPHFLFNTLGVLRSLIRRDAAAATELLDRMTDFLRAVLPGTRQLSSTLEREAEIIEAYLAIMGSRLGDRLRYRIQLEPISRRALLPPLLLQPLVENAIKHGIEPSEAGGEVLVCSRIDGGFLVLEVRNTGEPFDPAPSSGTHPAMHPATRSRRVGIDNIAARLRALCGSSGSLLVGSAPDGATLATVRLPFVAGG